MSLSLPAHNKDGVWDKSECVSCNNDLEPKDWVILTASNIKVDIYRRKKTVLTEGTNNKHDLPLEAKTQRQIQPGR